MTQGVGAILCEDVLRDPTAKCLAEISDLIGSKLAEPAPHAPPRDVWNSQPEAQLFDEEVVIKEVLDALPNGSAIAFSAHQLEVLFSGSGPVLADTKTAATIIERLAHACGCSFALHGDTGTFTKNLIDTAQANRVTLTSSAVVEGEIHRRSLAIEENARFVGMSHSEKASASGTDRRSPIRLVPTNGNRQANGSLAQPNFSPMLPVVEPSNELVFYCKTHSNGYRTTQEGLPNVQYEPREFPVVYSVGSQDQSAKRISRGSLQIAILALTVGAITGAGAVFALVGHPSHQYTAALTAPTPAIIIQQAANLPTPEPASDGRRKVSDETPPWPVPLDAYASPPMNNSSSQISGAPDHPGQMTNRTNAMDMPSSLTDAANEEDARQTGRKTSRYISTHRFTHWQHRYRYAFHRYWRRYRYAFHSLRKGWI